MKRGLSQSRSLLVPALFVRADVLRGGQSPRSWKRELFRQTGRMATVSRSCLWLKQLAEVRPAMFDQPLLGNCLTEVTSTGRQPADVAETEARGERRRLNRPAPVPRRVNRKMTEETRPRMSREKPDTETRARWGAPDISEPSKPRGKGDEVFQLPPKADGLLLKRSAGTLVQISKDQEVSLAQLSPLPRRQPHSSSRVVTPSLGNQDWRNLISFRAARTWVANWPVITTRAAIPHASSNAPEQTREVEGSDSPPLLADQWVTPLIGPQASPEMLVYLTSQVEPQATRSETRMKRTTPDSSVADNPFTVRPNSSGQKTFDVRSSLSADNRQESSSRRLETTFTEQDQRRLATEIDQEAGVQRELAATNAQRESQSASHFAPPSLSRSLPPLLPAVSPGAPVLSMAADAARSGAWRDEVSAHEPNLGILAAQMKRILDEEARRHGIDV